MKKQQADQILIHGYILTMDAERRVYTDGAVAIRDGKILSVEKTEAILAAFEGPIFDCGGGVVHPGLVDAHVHTTMHITRGWEPDTFTVNDTWLQFERYFFPTVTAKEECAGVEYAVWEMARNGTTTFSDTGGILAEDTGEVLHAANRSGIRGQMCILAADQFNPELAFLSRNPEQALRRIESDRRQYGNFGRVRAGVQICGMGDASDEIVTGAKQIADAFGDVLFMHQCAYPEEIALYREKYNATPIEHLKHIGVLDDKTTLVHMIRLTEEDVGLLAENGTSVVHCPAASMKFGLGASSIGKFPEMAAAGVNLALGCDSGTWSDALDIFTQAYLAAMIHREARRQLVPINSYKAFEMATIGGAKALGMEKEIGSLEPGKCADVVIHGTDIPESQPAFDPFTNLIYAARSKSVRHVLVDGEWIIRDGRSTRMDEEELISRTRNAAFTLAKNMHYDVKTVWKRI